MWKNIEEKIPFIFPICIVVSGILIYWLFGIVQVFGGMNVDIVDYLAPKLLYMGDQLRSGSFPMWYPLEFGGSFLFGTGSKPLIEAPLMAFMSLGWFLIFVNSVYILANFACFSLLATEIGLSRLAGMVGASVYCFNRYNMGYGLDVIVLAQSFYLPLVLFAFLRFSKSSSKMAWICIAALAMGGQATYGRPSDLFYMMMSAAFLSVLFFIAHRRGEIVEAVKRSVQFWLTAALMGAAVAAVIAVPFIDNLLESTRYAKFGAIPHITVYVDFIYLIEVLVPFLVSDVMHAIPDLSMFAPDYNRGGSYIGVGLSSFVFLLAAFFLPVRPFVIYRNSFIFLLVFTMLFMLPIGLFDLLRKLPLQEGAREVIRFMPVFNLAFAVLVAMGFDGVARNNTRANWGENIFHFKKVIFISIFILGCLQAIWFKFFLLADGALGFFQLPQIYITLGWMSVVIFVLFLKGLLNRCQLALAVSVLVMASNLPIANAILTGRTDLLSYDFSAAYGPTKSMSFIKARLNENPGRVVGTQVGDRSLAPMNRLETPRFYESIVPRAPCDFYTEVAGHWCSGSLTIYDGKNLAFLDLMNVRYILERNKNVRPPRFRVPQDRYPVVFRDVEGGATVYENPGAFDRVFFVDGYSVVEDRNERLNFMREKYQVAPGWFSKNVVLEGRPEIAPVPGAEGKARVLEIKHEPHRVAVEVLVSANTIMVMSDNYDPYWRVTVNGEEAKLLRANHFMRALPLKPGKNIIEMNYEPVHFYFAGLVSILSIFAILVYLASRWRARQPSLRQGASFELWRTASWRR